MRAVWFPAIVTAAFVGGVALSARASTRCGLRPEEKAALEKILASSEQTLLNSTYTETRAEVLSDLREAAARVEKLGCASEAARLRAKADQIEQTPAVFLPMPTPPRTQGTLPSQVLKPGNRFESSGDPAGVYLVLWVQPPVPGQPVMGGVYGRHEASGRELFVPDGAIRGFIS